MLPSYRPGLLPVYGLNNYPQPFLAPALPLPSPSLHLPADVSVKFRITLSEAKMREALAAGLLDKFKLKSKISTGEGVAGWLWEKKGERCRGVAEGHSIHFASRQ